MPGKNQQLVARNYVAKNVGVRKNRAEHQRPGRDPRAVHGEGQHFVAAENRFADQRSGDPVGDGVQWRKSLQDETGAERRPKMCQAVI